MSVQGIADYLISEDFTKEETLEHHLGRNIFYLIHSMSQDTVKQLSLGFLVAQTVKNLPAMRKT